MLFIRKVVSLSTSRHVPEWLLPLWACFSLSCVFSLLMWQQSTGAGLNIFDALVSLPSLLILGPLMIRRGWVGKGFLMAAAPLAVYLAFSLVSMAWANSPDYSKTFRAAGQATAIFVLFSYLKLSGHTLLLKRALLLACVCTASLGAWHLFAIYGLLDMPWTTTLYQGVGEQRLGAYGVKPANAMLATLLVAPQAAMLLGLILGEENRSLRWVGVLALAVLLLFLVALERRTGQVAIIVAIVTCIILYRNRVWYLLFGATVLCGILLLIFYPEFILSRGLSWRPAIWMSTLDSIGSAPFFGHGITNKVTPVVVFDHGQGVIQQFRHPHNMALSVIYFLGLFGFVFWVALWAPGVLARIWVRPEKQQDGYMLIPLLVGLAALMFDGGDPLSPFHFDWFCFWVPAMLLLSSQAVNGQQLMADKNRSRFQYFFPRSYDKQV